METFRGGLLMLVRWLFHYPIVFGTYRLRGFTRAPFMLDPKLQETPGILVSNYGNYFFDDMIGMMFAPVWPFVFVRESICRFPLLQWIFEFHRALPIVRSSDPRYTPEQRKERNEATFTRVVELLKRGHWLSVFPETFPGHRPRLRTPLKPGAAHVALRAEAASGWKLGLKLYVYGVNYENKFVGRSNVFFRWASPIDVVKYQAAYESSPLMAEQALMQEVENTLRSVVLEAENIEQLASAHRLAYQRKKVSFLGVQEALHEVVAGRSSPEDLRRIVCSRAGESVVYQVLGYLVFGLGWALGWPLRKFGRLCAADPSQEMTYQFFLWVLVLDVGMISSGEPIIWFREVIIFTWVAMTIWLWAWRRGIIQR